MPEASGILRLAGELSRESIKCDFEKIDGSTAGGRLYLERGIRGIRGEVMDGFPSVMNLSLPSFKKALNDGKNKNDAGAYALLHLIKNVYDTSVYNRGGHEGVTYAMTRAGECLKSGYPTEEELLHLDSEFTERNLSPGGSADLLALTYFLNEIEKEKD